MGKYLVCYFSPTGTTMTVANEIADAITADRLEIKAKEPYTEADLNWRKFFSRCNKEHRRKTLPEVDLHILKLSQYSVVFLGFPIWYGTAPNLIFSFLETNDWSGQKLVLFATSGSDGIGQAREDITAFLGGKGEVEDAELLQVSDKHFTWSWARNTLDRVSGKLAEDAEAYVKKHYVEPAPEPKKDSGVRFSRDLSSNYLAEIERLQQENIRLMQKIREYNAQGKATPRSILDRYDSDAIRRVMRSSAPSQSSSSSVSKALNSYTDQSFVGKMMSLIREKGLKETDVYNAAQIDRRLFSKIVSDQDYKPSKDTCVAIAYAMKLGLPEANDLLSRAGYTLSHSSKRDVLLEYFFSVGIYNLLDINDTLVRLDQKPLGRQS